MDKVKTTTTCIKVGNTTYEVISTYTGKTSLLDLIKNAIKREIEIKVDK